MHLGKLYSQFDSRCRSYSVRINEINMAKSTISNWQFNHLTEVLISDIWQSWCNFCRELFMSSCRGTVAKNGTSIIARTGDNSWKRISYEAKQASSGRSVTTSGHSNFFIRHEPTWGDLDVFIKIVTVMRPSNYMTLQSIYGSFTDLKTLQKVRNACAHKNVETMLALSMFSSSYSFVKLKNATDIVWTSKLNSSEFVIELWLFEMNLIADYATSQL